MSKANENSTYFQRINIPGFTDQVMGTNGMGFGDINKDGLVDIIVSQSPMEWYNFTNPNRPMDQLRVFLNQGNFTFKEHRIKITNREKLPADDFGSGSNNPYLVDFNNDGFLDIYVTRNKPRGSNYPGNTLLISQGSFDTFIDVSEKMGAMNSTAYNRGTSIGDVNNDGWLDIAVGADCIGRPQLAGEPHSRLYVYQPHGDKFEDGHFKDIGGTDIVPGFGGFFNNPELDKAGPQILLRDLDNDGDLDLIQSYHTDLQRTEPEEYPVSNFGIYTWRNLLKETGKFQFENVTGNGLAQHGKAVCNPNKPKTLQKGERYDYLAPGLALPYLFTADIDNDGLLDVIAVGPTSHNWHVNSSMTAGALFRNLGNFKFKDITKEAGLEALNWTHGQWLDFHEIPEDILSQLPVAGKGYLNVKPYWGGVAFGDFNNDGWIDFIATNRSELPAPFNRIHRHTLFLNNGDGTFHPVKGGISGIVNNSICAEAIDLDNDGLLDLVLMAEPGNSLPGGAFDAEQWVDKVYKNNGAHGWRENRWLKLRFSGISHHRLMGAQVYVYEPGQGIRDHAKPLGRRDIFSNQTFKSSWPLEAHFGLGKRDRVDVKVILQNGKTVLYRDVTANQYIDCNLEKETYSTVK